MPLQFILVGNNRLKVISRLRLKLLLMATLLPVFLLITRCASDKYLIVKPINGYITFKGVTFTVTDNQVTINLDYIAHGTNSLTNYYAIDTIRSILNDIAQKSGIAQTSTSYKDSLISSAVVAESYSQATTFVKNLTRKLNTMSATSTNFKSAVFELTFFRNQNFDRSTFRFSRYLFEPFGLIDFTATDGNLQFSPKADNTTVRINTSNYTNAAFVVTPAALDSVSSHGTETLIFDFKQPPLPWYSWTRIRNIFSSDETKPATKSSPAKKTFEKNSDRNMWSGLWRWVKDQIGWIASVCTILAFLFFVVDRKKSKNYS